MRYLCITCDVARELARREPSIAVNALHPGSISTNIWNQQSRPVRSVLQFLVRLFGRILPPPEKGAAPVTRLASDPALEGVTGRYFKRFREAAPSRRGLDDAAAARLWDVAGEATGV